MLIIMLVVPVTAADRLHLDRDLGAAPVKQLEHLGYGGLWLDRDHPGTQPAERGHAVTDMGADIEHQIAAPNKPAI